ncbi:zinc ribbon domain-containing protein [Actinosynnema sp. NPDC020468]|uniref:zinc ribbon domain-containing protein n=1 Tax=Actinosynnema sp. NPDC020468 TaxID=3154488 RepID=UPI0033E99B33
MSAFKTEKVVITPLTEFDAVAEDVVSHFGGLGYEVEKTRTDTGVWDIGIHKGGKFKAVAGLKLALKVLLQPDTDGVVVYAGMGVFGKQAAPALLGAGAVRVALVAMGAAAATLLALPLLVTQAWGLVKQAKLDDEAVRVVEASIRSHERRAGVHQRPTPIVTQRVKPAVPKGVCPACRGTVPTGAAFCNECGASLS